MLGLGLGLGLPWQCGEFPYGRTDLRAVNRLQFPPLFRDAPMLGLGLGLWPTVLGGGGDSAVDEILLESGDKLLLETGSAVRLNTDIPLQNAASAMTGSEYVAIVQGGVTKRLRADILALYLQAN
jgi:hypothetical protein